MNNLNREFKFRIFGDIHPEHSNGNPTMDYDITLAKLLFHDGYYVSTGGEAEGCYRIMQYTGMKDKNGKEIYEGDILDSGSEHGYLGENVFVAWNQDELQWVVSTQDNDFRDCLRSCFADKRIVWEVVGNIYENPKLLSA